jgi:hypothetical protein
MKRVLLFLALAIGLDRGIAFCMSAIESRAFTGDRSGAVNAALRHDADILILGSSRAQMQIIPKVLAGKLSMTTYNAGLKGQDFLYAVMLFDLWRQAHPAPKAIVLTLDVESMTERPAEVATAQFVATRIDQSDLVREVMYSGGTFKRVEYLSRGYRFNGQLFSLLKHSRGRFDPGDDGFRTGSGHLDPAADTGVVNALDQYATQMDFARMPPSAQKVRYLRELAEWSRLHGTRVFLLHTPLYRQDQDAHAIWMGQMQQLVRELPGVEIIDLCTASRPDVFAGHPELYMNLNHLNVQGATRLTELLAAEVAARLAKN